MFDDKALNTTLLRSAERFVFSAVIVGDAVFAFLTP